MPNCSETNHACGGQGCTVVLTNGKKSAWYRDCKTKNTGTGATYAEARKNATAKQKIVEPCAGLSGETLEQCKNKEKINYSPNKVKNLFKEVSKPGQIEVKKALDREIKRGGDTGVTRNPNLGDVSNLILGSPEDWGNTIKEQSNCFGIPIPCPLLAIGVGAIVLLLVVMR